MSITFCGAVSDEEEGGGRVLRTLGPGDFYKKGYWQFGRSKPTDFITIIFIILIMMIFTICDYWFELF